MASIGPLALGAKGCVERLHRFAQGGRRLAVRKTIEYQIVALPRTPFPAAREFPSRGNKEFEEKNRESYTSCTTPAIPLWWLAPPPSPHFVVGLWMLNHGAMSLQESIERFILPPEQGWQGNTIRKGAKRPENRVTRFPAGREGGAVRHQRGESHRRWLIDVMLIMPYDIESQSRNADFISIARRAIRNPRGQRPRQTYEPSGP